MHEHEKDINLLHERDLEKFLEQEKLSERFKKGEILCKFCRDKITVDNLYSILPESGMFNFICHKAECIQKLLEHLDNKKNKAP